MPESEDFPPSGLHLPADDPAAPAVDALRAMASQGSVQASAELTAFLDDPTVLGSGTTPSSRRDLVTVVRLPIRRAGRVAVAVGAALALAAIGGVAVAATGGTPDREPAQVQQDDPSDTSTTTESPETETSTTATDDQGEDQAEDQDGDDQGEDTDDADAEDAETATHTANPVASANHHDGKGKDDEHADVNGGGVVDHHSEHATAPHQSGDDDEQGEDEGDGQGEDHGSGHGDHQGDDEGDDGGSHGDD